MLNLLNLTDEVRSKMLDEIKGDIAGNRFYLSPRLNKKGRIFYPRLLMDAAESGDDESLAAWLRMGHCMSDTEVRQTRAGPVTSKMPVNASQVLAEGEFNRYYVRALCRVAIEKGIPALIVYRARESAVPRSVSEQLVGMSLEAKALLEDLRNHIGVDTEFHLPPGPNSGLSARLP